MNIDDLLRIATERKASDLHLKVGNYPHLRIDGELVPLTDAHHGLQHDVGSAKTEI
jgi:twitching motility protein PilT